MYSFDENKFCFIQSIHLQKLSRFPDNPIFCPPEGQCEQDGGHEHVDATLDFLEEPEAICRLEHVFVLKTVAGCALFKGPDVDINLHVFSPGSPEIERMLFFRNWLRNNVSDRHLYEQTKRELARKDWKYTQNYADAKTVVVEGILVRAHEDASRGGA